MSKDEYQRYIASNAWMGLRRAVRERADDTCERCKCCSLEETAHRTYDRLYNEDIDDLAGLCASCHRYIDGKADDDHATTIEWEGYPSSRDVNPLHWGIQVGLALGKSDSDNGPTVMVVLRCNGSAAKVQTSATKIAQLKTIGVFYPHSMGPTWDDETHQPSGAERWTLFKRNKPTWGAICPEPDCGVAHEVPFEPKFGPYVRCRAHYEAAVT